MKHFVGSNVVLLLDDVTQLVERWRHVRTCLAQRHVLGRSRLAHGVCAGTSMAELYFRCKHCGTGADTPGYHWLLYCSVFHSLQVVIKIKYNIHM